MKRQYTGYKDRNGRKIYEGHKVRFHFCADHGSSHRDTGCCGWGLTKMDDLVVINHRIPYFMCPDTGGGAFAYRFNKVCRIIGRVTDPFLRKYYKLMDKADKKRF